MQHFSVTPNTQSQGKQSAGSPPVHYFMEQPNVLFHQHDIDLVMVRLNLNLRTDRFPDYWVTMRDPRLKTWFRVL